MLRSVIISAAAVSAWYLPGIAPTDYTEGDDVNVLVNRLSSIKESQNSFGIDYYNQHLHFCEPHGGKQAKGGSLGAILFGDRIYTSPMILKMLKNEECVFLCKSTYSETDIDYTRSLIRDSYQNNWLIDGLPVSEPSDDRINYTGIPLGAWSYDNNTGDFEAMLFNHFDITVQFHHNKATQKYRVVGASVRATSRNTTTENTENFTCQTLDDSPVSFYRGRSSAEVAFSYSVKWENSETPWATRWDKYLTVLDPEINWFALINISFLVVSLGMFCAFTLTKMLRRDIARYNNVDLDSDDIPDEIGWKLVAGDVFRTPPYLQLYALAVGSGVQTLITLLITLTLAALGFLSPANRGSFSTALLLLNTVLGGVGGYVSAVTYKTWGGTMWKVNLLLTPLVLPAIIFGLFFALNILLAVKEASGAVPFGSIVAILLIWAGISVPLSLVCGILGFKRSIPYPPNIRVNQIARQIPPKPWYYQFVPMMLIGGVIPFLAVSLQLKYIFSAVWSQRIYYMFGFLFGSTWAMVLLSASSALLALYFTLVSEDYRWQWRTFCVAGSPSLYIFLYACYYSVFRMQLNSFLGVILFITYSWLVSMLCFLALGSFGSITAYLFVRKIYESIRID